MARKTYHYETNNYSIDLDQEHQDQISQAFGNYCEGQLEEQKKGTKTGLLLAGGLLGALLFGDKIIDGAKHLGGKIGLKFKKDDVVDADVTPVEDAN